MGLCFSSGNKSKVSPSPETTKTNYEILQSLQFLNLKRYQFPELTADLGNNLVFAEVVRQNDKLLEKIKHVQELSHPNLMKLIGFCLKDQKWHLVYEFVACSLNDYLRGTGSDFPPSTWSVRMKIVVGVAKGLAFLHHDAQLMYMDFKPRHVLLDSEGNAKLSDVGLAKERPAMGSDEVYLHARCLGTPGYAAPEFISTGALTAKCNVYSFGMILLEMLTGKVATRIERPGKNEDAEEWAMNLVNAAEKDSRVIMNEFASLQEKQHFRSKVLNVAQLAFKCVSEDPTLRPDMNYVVQFLDQLN